MSETQKFIKNISMNNWTMQLKQVWCPSYDLNMHFKVGAPGNLAKTLYESKKLLKFIETVNILLTQINIQEKG